MTHSNPNPGIGRRTLGQLLLTAVAAACLPAAHAQGRMPAAGPSLDAAVAQRIDTLLQEKEARTPAQAKLASSLWYSLQAQRGQTLPDMDEVYRSAVAETAADDAGLVEVDIVARVNDRLLGLITAAGGQLGYVSAPQQAIRAKVPLSWLETLASISSVVTVVPAARGTTNVGSVTGQGVVSHKAKQVVMAGTTGAGVRVGVLSDSVGISAAQDQLVALKASGDLPADAAAVTGQDGGAAASEGTAMMEIVADMAPGATIYFATASTSAASFADNIRTLRAPPYNCDIIVDDYTYFNEGAFQDGPIARAVNDVTASGALYFSSAANGGNVTSGTAGVWEGDFNAGPPSAAPLPTGYTLHLFNGTQAYNTLLSSNSRAFLKWSDPLGASTNDYDLFVLNAAGTSIICAATNIQSGTQEPYEYCGTTSIVAGNRLVVAKKATAAVRALRLDTYRGTLSTFTNGAIFGHNGGSNTQSVAAVSWNAARTGTRPFVGGASNPTESFSSDGPRKMFYTPTGVAITPGNVLFGTNGGTVLAKPDIAAADGTFSRTPGFVPFYGTSAAAPHAAAIAALVKSARPDYTPAQIITAMKATALDNRAPGIDVDSGIGIVMAWEAVQYALTH